MRRLILVSTLLLGACAATPEPTGRAGRDDFDLRRSGSVARSTGTAGMLALCSRSMGVVRSLGVAPGLSRLGSACGAAGRL